MKIGVVSLFCQDISELCFNPEVQGLEIEPTEVYLDLEICGRWQHCGHREKDKRACSDVPGRGRERKCKCGRTIGDGGYKSADEVHAGYYTLR